MDTYDSNFHENQEPQAPVQPQTEAATQSSVPESGHISRIPPQGWVPPVQKRYEENLNQPQPTYQQPGPDFTVAPDGTYRYQPRQESTGRTSPYANSPYMNAPAGNTGYRYQPRTTPPVKDPTPRKKSNVWTVVISAVVAVALAVSCSLGTAVAVNRQWEKRSKQSMDALQQQIDSLQQQVEAAQTQSSAAPSVGSPVSADGLTPAQVYYENYRSVVTVRSTMSGYGQSSGSGFILTEDGYVVTNCHVVEDAASVSVVLHDDTSLPATVVGQDSANDVAVLKVESQGLPAVKLGSSSALNVGDMVVAIGNPLGELNFTQTVGYVCGKDREVTTGGTIINMLQIDAAINSGNSGGPLFNMNGEVVGITTAKYSGITGSGASIEGIGFAIPIDDVMGIIEDLQNFGYVTGAYMGVIVQNMSEEIIDTFGTAGAYVVEVEPGYAAARAGLQPKDIIVAVDGSEVRSITDLTRILRNYNAGDTATLTVIRNFVKMELSITLDEKPNPNG